MTAIAFALTALSSVHLISGELQAAASLIDEIRAVSDATGIAAPPYGPLWLAALRGYEAELSALIETIVSQAVARGEGFVLADTELVRAILSTGSAATRPPGPCSVRAASTPAISARRRERWPS